MYMNTHPSDFCFMLRHILKKGVDSFTLEALRTIAFNHILRHDIRPEFIDSFL